MKKYILPLVAGVVVLMFSCKEESNCTTYWTTEINNPSLIMEIDEENEALSIQITDFASVPGEIYQSYFTGDVYDVIANFENFSAPAATGTNGRAFIEMMMYNTNFPDTVLDSTAIKVGISSTHIYSSIGYNQYQEKARLSTTNSGKFRIRKQGNNIQAYTIAGGDTVVTSYITPLNPTRFGFRIGTINDSLVTGTVGIKILNFNVIATNTTTLYTDDFTCNSIY